MTCNFYNHLRVPDYLLFAFKEQGVVEIPGPESNERINQYLACVGLPPDDEIPWCVAGGAFSLKSTGYKIIRSGAARDWEEYASLYGARKATFPRVGLCCILWRESIDSGLGHFGFLIGWNEDDLFLYGANQKNRWRIDPYPKEQLLVMFNPVKEAYVTDN